jgi:membrane protease YdiL (CAAX protease family)
MILWPMYFLFSITWGWIYLKSGSLKMAILIHVLSNLFYAVVGFAGWDILA